MIVTAISLPKYEHRRMVHLQVQKLSTRTENELPEVLWIKNSI